MHTKSSHHIHLEMIEKTLQPNSCFQLHAAKHKALIIRDALADDHEYCEALLLKIDHLLGEAVVTPATAPSSAPASAPVEPQTARSAA